MRHAIVVPGPIDVPLSDSLVVGPFVGPMQRRIDLTVSKLTRLGGSLSLELRLEAYNLTNTASFRNPNSDLSDGDFGEITRTVGGSSSWR